jgi:BirA family biotin operon repressor/biotin-[acetyl-CoA-carboxylase] ligase
MAGPVFEILDYDTLESTNDEARRLAEDGGREGLVIHARKQTAGRGRQGRRWISEEGNLFASLLLRPEVPLMQAATLPFVAAAALTDTLAPKLGAGAALTHKWPNDVLLGGKKISGILLESGGSRKGLWIVVGIGVNVSSYPEETLYPATSLAEAGVAASAEEVLRAYLLAFSNLYQLWLGHGFAPVRKTWLRRADHLGQAIAVRQGDGEPLHGIFEDVDETGALRLRLPDGSVRNITAGDVFLVD